MVRVRGSPPERLSGTTVARIVVVVVVQPRPCYLCKGTHFRNFAGTTRGILILANEVLLEMETFVLGAAQQWRHGCVLARHGDMGACWVRAGQQWRHGCALGGC